VRQFLIIALSLGLLMQAERLSASTFRVTPVRVELSQRTSSALLTLANESDQDLRFQISASAWTQDAGGNMQLTPTKDVTFFPALLSLKPGEERKVRIGARVPAADVEKTYRIFFEELPPLATAAQPPGAQVRILTKMGIPIFLSPQKPRYEAAVQGARAANGMATFEIQNNGNVHFSVQGVTVRGRAADGSQVFERRVEGWYVLPGTPRAYQVEIPADACPRVVRLEIEAETDLPDPEKAKPAASIDVAPSSCKNAK
jgi:fimbrial chaperone protein